MRKGYFVVEIEYDETDAVAIDRWDWTFIDGKIKRSLLDMAKAIKAAKITTVVSQNGDVTKRHT